jgi:hypothetical protein
MTVYRARDDSPHDDSEVILPASGGMAYIFLPQSGSFFLSGRTLNHLPHRHSSSEVLTTLGLKPLQSQLECSPGLVLLAYRINERVVFGNKR